MSCNGCRVLRKGCSDTCTLRPCLQWIDTPEAQGHATVFVAKFFGRAGLMSFIGGVPESQRPALFQSLLYEACGRTVNPVHGAVGLLWSNNWHICQGAVETVLKGGTLRPAISLPVVSNPLPCLPAMPVSSIHRMSKIPAVPEAGALTLSSSEPSSSVARCSTEAFRPKRPLDEPKMGAAERSAAGSSQERTDGKRCRAGERESSVAKLDFGPQEQQQQPPPKINPPSYWDSKPELSKQAASTATECNDLRKREKSPSMAGQLVAPVPIRVRPRLDDTEFHAHIRSGRGQAMAIHDGTLARSSDKVELDLSLNSIPPAPFSFVRMKPGFMRVSSPSTISVNSEGSVTSLDTADLSMSPWRRRSSCSSPKQQEQKLLDLLL